MKYKVFLFDTDGVVVLSEMFSNHYSQKNNIPKEEMLPFFTGVFQDCMKGKADLKEVIKPWLVKWQWNESVDEFLKQWFEHENNIDEKVIEFINQLKKEGIKCYLATNQEKYRTEYLKNKMKFGELFDGIFSSAYIGHKKPTKEFYEFILDNLNIPAKEIFYLDDDVKNIEIAKELGIESYLYKDFDKFIKYLKTKTD
ncbi:MAG: HAD-IA family hydrolase [Candidatus Magasanikbacteria bacterium]